MKLNLSISRISMVARFIILVLGCLLSGIAYSDYIEPGEVEVRTEKYKPAFKNFAEGTYRYDVKWQGIPVANAEVEVASTALDENKTYSVEARANTSKVIDVLYRLRHTSESVFDGESLRPIKYSSEQTENSKVKKVDISFDVNGVISSVTSKNGKIEDKREFSTSNLTLDPISAAFLARSIPINVGASVDFDVYNGKNRYLISFKVLGLEDIEVEGEKGKVRAFKVVPRIQKLTDTEGETRFRKAEIWISADEKRDVLKIESEVIVGKIGAYLSKFSNAENNSESIAVAKASLDVN